MCCLHTLISTRIYRQILMLLLTTCAYFSDIEYAAFVIEYDLMLTMVLTVFEKCDIFQACFEHRTNFDFLKHIGILIHLQLQSHAC